MYLGDLMLWKAAASPGLLGGNPRITDNGPRTSYNLPDAIGIYGNKL